MGWPVIRAVAGGLRRRRVQALVIFLVVLIATGATTLGLAMLGNTGGPWQQAFEEDHGADVVTTIKSAHLTNAQLAATRRLPGVTQSMGPFGETTISGKYLTGDYPLPPISVAGRASPEGRMDDLELITGRWAQRPGEIVLSADIGAPPVLPIGSLSITSAPGQPKLKVVGFAESITDSADAWVAPAQLAALRPVHEPATVQMLYDFRNAATAAQIRAGAAAVSSALPAGSVTRNLTWLTARDRENVSNSVIAPFVVAFAIMALALSALIVANVVSGAVVAGYRRIGILKSLGFTPAQVTIGYIARVGAPALPGIVLGAVLGNVLAVPVLKGTAYVFGVGRQHVPLWANIGTPLGMCALVLIAALLPAIRAGRLSAGQVMVASQAPRVGRGHAPYRILGRLRLPRPVTLGLGAPFARPGRALVALVVILFGTAAVIFAMGLDSSLSRAATGSRDATPGQVVVTLAYGSGPAAPTSSKARKVVAAMAARPQTLQYVAEANPSAGAPSLPEPLFVEAFNGDASWIKFEMISGRWYRGPGEIVVNTAFLNESHLSVGDNAKVYFGSRSQSVTARIVGVAFDPTHRTPCVFTDWQTLGPAAAGLTVEQYDIKLRPGADPGPYAVSLGQSLGSGYGVGTSHVGQFYGVAKGLLRLLTVLIVLAAALGVLNTVLLGTRDRVHDLGVFKAVGMTPRQSIVMVVCWVAVPGVIAAAIAVPAGLILHSITAHNMGRAADTGIPPSFLHVYGPLELVLLALAGLVIAVAGAFLPARWAASSPTASVLRVE
jgi:putative ABC transport system permease protein